MGDDEAFQTTQYHPQRQRRNQAMERRYLKALAYQVSRLQRKADSSDGAYLAILKEDISALTWAASLLAPLCTQVHHAVDETPAERNYALLESLGSSASVLAVASERASVSRSIRFEMEDNRESYHAEKRREFAERRAERSARHVINSAMIHFRSKDDAVGAMKMIEQFFEGSNNKKAEARS